ncbi:MAG: hypothetical protein JGK12_02190 [Microcoleus sp. PH2017_01_SCD_O_A]|uniref:hypothetical protein n=1 Tax=unclassified Microcoleus TaxID=2642155 RepID=UPI001DD45BCC|nr:MULTISPECIES: hypothetical protein [unclassified Microcoleus]MCC3429557.1 hypothetical protein [Microcoleus sp. PH2017_04_SCI_O_A]MCC3465266.1 hypothetical protein [Microcoleus sp. PH2017_06_SFM_O_A]TAF86892.1 MAG: hypothetical protein EAZ49_21760 [Oscillatoriales cyanobacterium]MCC3422747.1 hypothetical protein [Microcoleus sp. PH2017_01_SCD_O_A]MCC3446714.1 hypothetical protein [Microcoleus sp. PH2017_09_SFU_O_A]
MQVREVLQFVDKVVYAKTGKHLNDLQRGIIEGTLKRQKYPDIAENCGCSAGHAKDVGYELLQMLSDVLDEPVDKKNLKSVLERQGNLTISFGDRSKSIRSINSNIIGCLNVSSEQAVATGNESQSQTSDFQRVKNKARIEAVGKLRQFGLSDEQIAEVLELPLDVVERVNLQE